MTGNGSVELNASVEQVWAKILNPEVLADCIMGCKELVLQEDGKYRADLAVGVAAVKGKYDATIQLADVEELKSYKLIVRGEGAPGFVEAEGLIELTRVEEGTTALTYSYQAEVGGKVASIGQRMLGGVAKLLISDFFKKMKKQVENEQKTA